MKKQSKQGWAKLVKISIEEVPITGPTMKQIKCLSPKVAIFDDLDTVSFEEEYITVEYPLEAIQVDDDDKQFMYIRKKEKEALLTLFKIQLEKAREEGRREGLRFAFNKLTRYNIQNATYRQEPTSVGNQELAREIIEEEYLKSWKDTK